MKKTLPVLLFFFALYLIKPCDSFSGINARADFTYTDSETSSVSETSHSSSFSQLYDFSLSKRLTNTIVLNGSIRLSIVEIDGEKEESMYPVIYLYFTPPALYNFALSYNRTETYPPDGDRLTNTNFNTSLMLPTTRWPSLSLAYNHSTIESHDDPQSINSTSSNITLNTAYSFRFDNTDVGLNYAFSYYTTENKAGETKTNMPSHVVSGGVSRSFWGGKASMSMNAGYNWSELTTESLGAPTRFDRDITPNQGIANDVSPVDGIFDSEPDLINNITDGNPGDVTPALNLNTSSQNVGIGFLVSESVHTLYVYVYSPDETNITGNPAWQLYTSAISGCGGGWTLVGSISPTYDSAFHRFEFDFSTAGFSDEISATCFRVVNSAGLGVFNIRVTEIEAIGYLLATPQQEAIFTNIGEFGGISFSFIPTERFSAGVSTNYNRQRSELNDGNETEMVNISHGGNINYIIIPRYLNFFASYSMGRTEPKKPAGATSGSNNYSLSFSSSPLSTVSSSLSFLRSESLSDNEVTSKIDSTSLSASMNLYKGIDVGLGGYMSEQDNISSDSTVETRSYQWNIRLAPWNPLTIVVDGNSSKTTTETGGGESEVTGKTSNIGFSYRPAGKIHFSGQFSIEPSRTESYSVSWGPTRNIQFGATYNNQRDSNSHAATSTFSWRPIDRLTMSFNYSTYWVDDETDSESESFFARASISIW